MIAVLQKAWKENEIDALSTCIEEFSKLNKIEHNPLYYICSYIQSWIKFMKQCQEIKQNWTGQENFEICLCVMFDH